MKVRLNKFLSQCGLGSRRKVESFITSSRISINGVVTTNLATYIDNEKDSISVDKKPLRPLKKHCFLMMNKPKGYITTTMDLDGRPTVMDMIPEKYRRLGVFPIGRLDKDTEGLLLFTNDGDIAHRLTLPAYKVNKEYYVELNDILKDQDLQLVQEGLYIHQLRLRTKSSTIRFSDLSKKRLIITVTEGKKRQIRYTFKNLGYKIDKLRRIAYGPLKLGKLFRGSVRLLTEREIRALKAAATG